MSEKIRNPERRCKICGGPVKSNVRFCALCDRDRRAAQSERDKRRNIQRAEYKRLIDDLVNIPSEQIPPRPTLARAYGFRNYGEIIQSSTPPPNPERTTIIMDDETLAAAGHKWDDELQRITEATK